MLSPAKIAAFAGGGGSLVNLTLAEQIQQTCSVVSTKLCLKANLCSLQL
jgi:hypothetical protein